jgi:hypothetical protein
VYIRYVCREITKYTVIYGVYIRFWPTLHIELNHMLAACLLSTTSFLHTHTHTCTHTCTYIHQHLFSHHPPCRTAACARGCPTYSTQPTKATSSTSKNTSRHCSGSNNSRKAELQIQLWRFRAVGTQMQRVWVALTLLCFPFLILQLIRRGVGVELQRREWSCPCTRLLRWVEVLISVCCFVPFVKFQHTHTHRIVRP